jgi:hypothetical protein
MDIVQGGPFSACLKKSSYVSGQQSTASAHKLQLVTVALGDVNMSSKLSHTFAMNHHVSLLLLMQFSFNHSFSVLYNCTKGHEMFKAMIYKAVLVHALKD